MKLSEVNTAAKFKDQLEYIELTLRQMNKNAKDMAFDRQLRFPLGIALETLEITKTYYQKQLRDLGVEV